MPCLAGASYNGCKPIIYVELVIIDFFCKIVCVV